MLTLSNLITCKFSNVILLHKYSVNLHLTESGQINFM